MAKRILSISYDSPLLVTRQMLLQAYGYEVTSAEGFAEAMEHCNGGKEPFGLIIMGHSIPLKDKRQIISRIRKRGPAPVLSLLRPGEHPLPEADASVEPDDPRQLIAAVKRLLAKSNTGRAEDNA